MAIKEARGEEEAVEEVVTAAIPAVGRGMAMVPVMDMARVRQMGEKVGGLGVEVAAEGVVAVAAEVAAAATDMGADMDLEEGLGVEEEVVVEGEEEEVVVVVVEEEEVVVEEEVGVIMGMALFTVLAAGMVPESEAVAEAAVVVVRGAVVIVQALGRVMVGEGISHLK